ncbi:MAG: Imm8 family immunity protein [Thermoleophilaceae bacterium]
MSGVALEGPDAYRPDDPERFAIRVRALVGDGNSDASEAFDFVVCSPVWLAQRFANLRSTHPDGGIGDHTWSYDALRIGTYPHDVPLLGAGWVFMKRWDYARLWAAIASACSGVEAASWESACSELGRSLPWDWAIEYDRYGPGGSP